MARNRDQSLDPALVGDHGLACEAMPLQDLAEAVAGILQAGAEGHVLEAGEIGEDAERLVALERGLDFRDQGVEIRLRRCAGDADGRDMVGYECRASAAS